MYYLAAQVRDEIREDFPNPLVWKKVQTLFHQEECRELKRGGSRHPGVRKRDAEALIHSAVPYIEGVVSSLLSRHPACTAHLRLVGEACYARGTQNVSIATLNHDHVIDTYLKENRICYDDGFTDEDADGIRHLRHGISNYSQRDGQVRIMKLHGAVDWRYHWATGDPGSKTVVSVPHRHGVGPARLNGHHLGPPLIQIGTYNKILAYVFHRHLTGLQSQFLRSLDSADLLVVSGYSFGDDGINWRVREWADGPKGRGLVVVDPQPESVRRNLELYGYVWADAGVLRFVQKGIESTTWDEVTAL